jgi:hypothetical protein
MNSDQGSLGGPKRSLINFQLPELSGSADYKQWTFCMKMLLKYEKVWDHVNGAILPETQLYKLEKDISALSLIGLAIQPSLHYLIEDVDVAKEAWDILEKFLPQGTQGRCSLLGKLTSIKQDNFKNVSDYVTEFVTTAQKLKGIGFEIADEITACLMINGLSETYEPLAMALNATLEKLTTDLVTNRLIGEEQRRMNRETSGNASALVTSSKYNNGFKYNQSNFYQEKECGYCYRQGHIKKNCFVRKSRSKEARKVERRSRSKTARLQ